MTSKPAEARRRLALAIVLIAVIAAAFAAAPAGAVIVTLPSGKRVSIALRQGVSAASIPGSMAARAAQTPNPFDTGGNVTYHNSAPVMHSMRAYALLWDPGNLFTAPTKALIAKYFTDVAHDSGSNGNNFSVLQQYFDTTGYAAYQQTFGGSLSDTTAYPANGCTPHALTGDTICLSDAQLAAEVSSYVTANSLPKGLGTEYFIFTPPNVVSCFDAGSSQCSDNVFFAYHSHTGTGASTLIYANDPFTLEFDPAGHAGSVKGCQFDGSVSNPIQEPNGDIADVVLKAVGHEARESLSDPLLNAWFDPNGNELDDKCNSTGSGDGRDPNAFLPTLGGASSGTLFNQVYNAHGYYMQSEWSNGDAACRMAPSAGTVAPSFAVPAGLPAGTGMAFTGAAASAHPAAVFSWDFGDGTQVGGSSPNVTHAFAADGPHTVTLTVSDTSGNAASVTHTVVSGLPPTAAFAAGTAPTGTPITLNAAGSTAPTSTITSYDWDFGDGSAHGSGVSPSHAFAAPGAHTVTLTVTNGRTQSATVSHPVTATNRAPSAAFSFAPSPAGPGVAVAFDGRASSDPDGTIASYKWTFGDGSVTTGVRPSHTFASARSFTVALTVTDNNGGTKTLSKLVAVVAPRVSTLGFTKRFKAKTGGTLKVKLSGASVVTVRISRISSGRRNAKGTCVKATHALRKHKQCTLTTLLSGSVHFTAKSGSSSHHLSGKIGGHKLGKGTYLLSVKPAGGKARTARFTITG